MHEQNKRSAMNVLKLISDIKGEENLYPNHCRILWWFKKIIMPTLKDFSTNYCRVLKFNRFLSCQVKPSVERHVNTGNSSGSQQASFPWLPGLRNRHFQFVGSTNPDTGVPSPQASASQAYSQAASQVKPVSARVVSATSGASSSLAYNPVSYSGKCSSPLLYRHEWKYGKREIV